MQKKLPLEIKHTADLDCRVKSWKTKGGSVFLEGFANRAVIDRGNDVIPGEAWDLENYKKNPVILVNHGMDPKLGALPVGKAIKLDATKEGLGVKLRMSNSQTEDITRVRDLVSEGILTAMSVGFNPKKDQKGDDGSNVITEAELYEISLVGVPMNQDSVGAASMKSFCGFNAPKIKSITDGDINEVRSSICMQKGAWVAGAVHMAVYDLMKREKIDRGEIIDRLVEESGGSEEDLRAILAGEITPVPADWLDAFASVLGIDRDELDGLDKGDVEVEGASQDEEAEEERPSEPVAPATESEEGQGEKGDMEEDRKPEEKLADDEAADDDKAAEKGSDRDDEEDEDKRKQSLVIQTLIMSKDRFKSAEDAEAWAKGNNFRTDKIDETDASYRFRQRDPGDFIEGSFRTVPLTEGVTAVMGRLSEETNLDGKSVWQHDMLCCLAEVLSAHNDNADAVEIFGEAEKLYIKRHDADLLITKKDYALFFEMCDSYRCEVKQAEQEEVTTPTTPVNDKEGEADFGSPQIDLAKQTNVLLGALINEIQLLRGQVAQLMPKEEPPATEDSGEIGPTEDIMSNSKAEDEAKAASEAERQLVHKALINFDERLQKLGV